MPADPVSCYLAQAAALAAALPAWRQPQQAAARQQLAAAGWPRAGDERWRFTDLQPLRETEFVPAPAGADAASAVPDDGWLGALTDAVRLTLVNGRFQPAAAALPPGVEVLALAAPAAAGAAARLGQAADNAASPFTALNAALFTDGVVIRIAPGVTVARPLVLCHRSVANGRPVHSQVRVLVEAGAGSGCRLVETYGGTGHYFTNAVTELWLDAGARVDFVRVQDEGADACHVGATGVVQARDSRLVAHALNLGGRLARHDLAVRLAEPGAGCELNGLYLGGAAQELDTHTDVVHAAPQCRSRQLYKGILDGRAHGVFAGRLEVRPHTQQTDARQTSRALLLSAAARVHTQPHLLIRADDVKCAHGATVGQLDEDALFYLQARGIDPETARGLLTVAFAAEAIARLPVPALRQAVEAMLLERYGRTP